MSYWLVMLARRNAALESLPSVRKPLRITGGLPPGYVHRAAPSLGSKPTDPATVKESKATQPREE